MTSALNGPSRDERRAPTRLSRAMASLLRAIAPLVLALIAAGLIILAMGIDPLQFYAGVIRYGVVGQNFQRSLTLMAPMIIIAAGMIVAFRGQLWNLGYGAQFLLGAVIVAGFGPALFASVPPAAATGILLLGSIAVGAGWALIPGVLKARFGTNEIVTSLMMSFIGIGVVSLLVKGPFKDPGGQLPQTAVISDAYLLPYISGTSVHIGLLLALVIAASFQFLLSRTAWGLRTDVYGANPRAARHVGINEPRMIMVLFAISGALIGLAGGIDVLGQQSYLRADADPRYGDAVLPLVFLARLSPLAVIPFVAVFAVLATGGILASAQVGLNADFLLIVVGLTLLFMLITELATAGRSYLPRGLSRTVASLRDRVLPGSTGSAGHAGSAGAAGSAESTESTESGRGKSS